MKKMFHAIILSLAVLVAAPALAQTAPHTAPLTTPAKAEAEAPQPTVIDPHLTQEQKVQVAEAVEAVKQAMQNFELTCRRIDGANDLGDSMLKLSDGKWYRMPHQATPEPKK